MNTPLTDAQRALAERYIPLARKLVKPIKAMYPTRRDEFESAACLGLIQAAREFDPARGAGFATFARTHIRWAVAEVCRTSPIDGKRNDRRVFPTVVTFNPYHPQHGEKLVDDAPPPARDIDAIDFVERLFRQLPRRHAQACRLYFIAGKSQSGAARTMGCSQSEVTRLIRASLRLLADDPRLARRAA